jgi:tetratricopeptide (TPR) repeat protein
MANQRKKEVPATAKGSPVGLILASVVCLGIGIGIGYYWGRQSNDFGAPFTSSQTQTSLPSQGAMQDIASLNENEIALKARLATNPKDLDALIQLGNLYYDYGHYREAVEWYGKALEVDPGNPNVRTDRGTCYWRLNQPEAAIAEFQKSLEADPAHAQTLYNLGVVYLQGKNDPESARKAWLSLLAANPNYPERAKVEQQLAALPAPVPAASAPAQQQDSVPAGMEDLLDRLKSRP